MLSIIIPSYKDPLLNKTIQSLLSKAKGDIEIIPVLDGYEQQVHEDPRVHVIYLSKNGGMRNAINTGVKMARGEFIMRVDEHCDFDEGYDVKLTKTFEDNWIVVPRRYKLDTIQWKVMDEPPIDYEKLIIDTTRNKFAGVPWRSREKERKDIQIDETMCMQGSCWVMKKSWWEKVIGELDTEKYGDHYQDQVEMIFKTWQAGGKLMVNKNTWYAHRHRKFHRTHNYPGDKADATFTYSLSLWREYYESVVRPLWKI